MDGYTQEDLKNALAPINSLIRKSEKAQTKLAEGTWQQIIERRKYNFRIKGE